MGFPDRWQAAVANLRLQTERMQATADALPPNIKLTGERQLSPDPLHPLTAHLAALCDYTTALACVQALLLEHEPGTAQATWN